MTPIEQKIRDRSYSSPQRARAALAMSQVSKNGKVRLGALIDAWENEGTVDHVVAGAPPEPVAHAAEVVERRSEPLPEMARPTLAIVPFMRLNLNARIRARLTPAGIAGLYAARETVKIPAEIVQNGGVWETELWEFMSVFASSFGTGSESPTVEGVFDVLDPRTRQP